MAGAAAADLAVARVLRAAAGVADRGRVDAGQLPEEALGAPEAAHADEDVLDALGERGQERRAEDDVALGNGDGLVPAGQRLLGCGNRRALGSKDVHDGIVAELAGDFRPEMTGRETVMQLSVPPTVPGVTTGAPNRPPAALTRLYTRLQATREPIERSLIGRIVLRFDIIDGSDRAAVLALNALLSLIPLAVLGVAVAHVYGVTSGNYADGLADVLNLHGRTATLRARRVGERQRQHPQRDRRRHRRTALDGLRLHGRALARVRPRLGRPQPCRAARVGARVRLADPVRSRPHHRRGHAQRAGTQHARRASSVLVLQLVLGFLVWLVSPVAAARPQAARGASSRPARR